MIALRAWIGYSGRLRFRTRARPDVLFPVGYAEQLRELVATMPLG